MKRFCSSIRSIFLLSASALTLSAYASVVSSTVEAPTAYFTPTSAQTFATPYYRYRNDDWSWSHAAVTDSFSSASLSVSAFDVDFAQGERDNIYAYDSSGGSGSWVLLGALSGANAVYAYTTFALGSRFFDDIQSGLKLSIDIDTTNAGWAVSLAKSVVSLDGLLLPPADPVTTPIPEPGTLALLALGLVGIAVVRGRKV